jgi:hypothetical protein
MNNESNFTPEIPENSAEVFTDDVKIIGPSDSVEQLNAYTVSCGVLTLDNREKGIVGLIHISLGGDISDIFNFASLQAKGYGTELDKLQMRRFKGSETIWAGVKKELALYNIKLPEWETTIDPGIKIDKSTGEVSFYV